MTIEVTDEDIKTGRRNSHDSCPVAIAIKRGLRTNYVSVGLTVLVSEGRLVDDLEHQLPNVSRFIKDFDVGKPVVPFSFDLEVPAK